MRLLAPLLVVVALAGCAPPPPPAPFGVRVTGQELKDLITGATVYGRSYTGKQGFVERYHPDGRYEFAYTKTAYSKEYGKKHKGTWRIDGDEVCYKVASLNSDGCTIIYRQVTQIEFVSPETGKTVFFSYWIEYEGKKPHATAAVPAPPAPPSASVTPTPPQPSKNLRPVSAGSGFIVNNQTFVLTNNHVIKRCTEVTVRIDDRDIRAVIGARDDRNDLALLRLPAGKHPVVAFRGNDGLYPGDSVVAIGYPLSDLLASEGNVSVGIVSALAGARNNANHLQISAPIQPGNSGGPLFDSSGNVVGVIVSGLVMGSDEAPAQNVNFAIKSSVATSLMQASSVKYKTRKSIKELRASDVARKGKPATVYIMCWK